MRRRALVGVGKESSKSTYKAAIRLSLGVFPTFCRDLHIFTKAHAPVASQRVHNIDNKVCEVGRIVANVARRRGDWRPN